MFNQLPSLPSLPSLAKIAEFLNSLHVDDLERWLSLTGLAAAALAALASTVLMFRWQARTVRERPIRFSVPAPLEAEPGWKGKVVSEGTLKTPKSNLINCYDPSTGYSLGQIPASTAADVDDAVSAAAAAQITWSKTTFSQRRRLLRTLSRFVLTHQQTIARVCARDSGKPMLDGFLGEILTTIEKLQWVEKHGEAALKPSRRPTNLLLSYKHNSVRYEPLGVVAACVSWNYPFHNFISPIIAALFAGNAIVVKPSERTAWSSAYFLSIVRGALAACGHSQDLVHSLLLWPGDSDALTSHAGISHITFIGSQPVAKLVAASAARALIPVCAELGGKDAAIVLDDIDSLERVGEIILRGTFNHAGQNCIGIERVIALPNIHDRLVEYLRNKISMFRLGSGLSDIGEEIDMGALVSGDRIPHLEHLVADAVKRGARLLAGGKRHVHPRWSMGHYFQPTLLVDVTPDMPIAREELFAPVCAVMRAESVSHAISLANSNAEFSLGASVFGSRRRDLDAVVSGVRAGMVAVNDFGSYYVVQLPFGGVGGSGYGRFAGAEGLQSLCNPKSVCEDRFPMLAKTAIPPTYQYPVVTERAWGLAVGMARLGYGLSLFEQAWGLVGILGNLARPKKK